MGRVIQPRRRKRPGHGPPSHHRAWLLPSIGLAGLVAIVMLFNLRHPRPGTAVNELPGELVGRWTTGDVRYRGRALTLTRDSVIFETGPGQPARRGRMVSLRTWNEGLVPVLSVEYDAGDGAETMDLMLVAPDSLRLRNPRDVLWTRESDGPEEPPTGR